MYPVLSPTKFWPGPLEVQQQLNHEKPSLSLPNQTESNKKITQNNQKLNHKEWIEEGRWLEMYEKYNRKRNACVLLYLTKNVKSLVWKTKKSANTGDQKDRGVRSLAH